jgi:hypothetical protein
MKESHLTAAPSLCETVFQVQKSCFDRHHGQSDFISILDWKSLLKTKQNQKEKSQNP